ETEDRTGGEWTVLSAESDRRVLGVGIGFVAEEHIKVTELTGGQAQGGVVDQGDAGANAQVDSPAQDGLVGLDQTKLISGQAIQCDVAFPAGARLLDQTRGRVHGIQMKAGGDLGEGIHPPEHALDPTLGELRLGVGTETGPAQASRRYGLVMAGILVVLERLEPRSGNG